MFMSDALYFVHLCVTIFQNLIFYEYNLLKFHCTFYTRPVCVMIYKNDQTLKLIS